MEKKKRFSVEFQRAFPSVTNGNVWPMTYFNARDVNLLEGNGNTSKNNTKLIVKFIKKYK
jgi:hypothetical protein